jgi:hypothetical protein
MPTLSGSCSLPGHLLRPISRPADIGATVWRVAESDDTFLTQKRRELAGSTAKRGQSGKPKNGF